MGAWRILTMVAGLAVFSATVRAADGNDLHYSRAATKKELAKVVADQLAAFRAGNFTAAYALASQDLREKFSLGQFTAMIERMYPAIAHNVRAEFGLSLDDGANATLPVSVFTADGRETAYRYFFVREADAWRISGVVAGGTAPGTNEI